MKYEIDPGSHWFYLYYLRRFKDLSVRFAHRTWRMWVGDPAMLTVTGQQEKLQHWLEGS